MKKKLYLITTILISAAVLTLSSCLKDSRFYTFSQGGTVVNFPLGGLGNFGKDAITDPGDTIVRQFSVEVASPTVPSTPTTVTLAVDNSIITAYNATGGPVTYTAMPAADFVFTATTVTIPAGQRTAIVQVTFYKGLLDPSLSYMLPIKIVSATGGGIVSGNFGIHYYHFIGNDFAGLYTWTYTRWQNGTGTGTPLIDHQATPNTLISPVSPSEFTAVTGYNNQGVRYQVDFTKTGPGAYSNWALTFVPADVTGIWGAAGITVVQQPVFLVLDPANKHFQMQYVVFNGTADRYLIDDFAKP
jgi:hypothetical protein